MIGPVETVGGDETPAAGGMRGVAALGPGDAGDGQGSSLGLGGNGLQFGSAALGRVEQVQVGEGAVGQPVLWSQPCIGVFGGQPGHGHGALNQAGAGGLGQVGGRHRRLTPTDEDPQAQVAALFALDVLQPAVADPDRQGCAFGRDRLGGIGSGAQGTGDEIMKNVEEGGSLWGGHGPIWRTGRLIATARARISPRRRELPAWPRPGSGPRRSAPCR